MNPRNYTHLCPVSSGQEVTGTAYALQAYTAQLDAYVGGEGDWATDGLDDDGYLDAPGAWHDGEALGDFLGA